MSLFECFFGWESYCGAFSRGVLGHEASVIVILTSCSRSSLVILDVDFNASLYGRCLDSVPAVHISFDVGAFVFVVGVGVVAGGVGFCQNDSTMGWFADSICPLPCFWSYSDCACIS